MEGYKLPSFTTVICTLFLLYSLYSVWSIAQLFVAPSCPDLSKCIQPYIASNPKYQLVVLTSTKSSPRHKSDVNVVYKEKNFNYNLNKNIAINISLPKSVRNNGSMFLHIFLTSKVDSEDWSIIVQDPYAVYTKASLTKFHIPDASAFNLLGDNPVNETKPSKNNLQKPVTHFHSVIVFNVMTDSVILPRNEIPYEIGYSLRLSPHKKYLPPINVDGLSSHLRNLVKVTDDMKTASLDLVYYPVSYGKLRLWMQFETALKSMHGFGFTEKDIDEVKGIFSDTNLYFLLITFIVAALHLVFDFLAFKNDISFWHSRESMEGISTTTVAWRAIAQIIVFLYLMDEETSLLVLIPAGIGSLIELWKVTKAFHVKVEGWKLHISESLTTKELETKLLDSEGIKYLSYILYPLCLSGAIYSLLYIPHKSWYSWIINSLVNGVYAFGFLFMLPQLFINYKLKSVAHLPWKAFMYKAFNTFIDDLFAFIITMPVAHRVACFRDDVVFLIYLYQRWLYPVDKTRVNEFGVRGEDDTKKKKE